MGAVSVPKRSTAWLVMVACLALVPALLASPSSANDESADGDPTHRVIMAQLVDADSGRPIRDIAYYYLVATDDTDGVYYRQGETQGWFGESLANLALWDIEISAPGYHRFVARAVEISEPSRWIIELVPLTSDAPPAPSPGDEVDDQATVSGRVVRADNGVPIGDVWVRIGGRDARTNTAGEYTAHRLEPGTYDVEVRGHGFEPVTLTDLLVEPSANLDLEVVELDLAPQSWPRFSDVPTDHQFESHIRWLSQQGITRGNSDGTFGAQNGLSREAMAAFLYRFVVRIDADVSYRSAYDSASRWWYWIGDDQPRWEAIYRDLRRWDQFYIDIGWLLSEEISTGHSDGTFRPKAQVTREAMAAFLYRVGVMLAETSQLDTSFPDPRDFTPPADSPFPDVPTTHKFYREITWLADMRITGGYANGTFRPKASVERQAMAAFLYRFDRRAHGID